MISNFIKFNESLENVIDKLKNDVTNAFAYISDDNTSTINVRDNEVYVVIDTILPSNVIYDDIKDYINKYELWNETLLDINVAIEQLTSRGNIGYILNINTVGNIKIKFHIFNDKLFTSDNNSVTISSFNLAKLIDDKLLTSISMATDRRYDIKFKFSENLTVARGMLLRKKIGKIFVDSGLITSDHIENIDFDNPYLQDDYITVDIRILKNNKNGNKKIKLQYLV